MANAATAAEIAKREIGRTGVWATPMALGCYSMSSSYGARSDTDSIQVIRTAIDRGVDLIDTANQYGWGHNERLVSTAIAGRRDEILLSSKFGYVKKDDGSLGVCGRPDHLRAQCEATLERLQTDWLDLYYQHRVDPDVPIEETVGAMADLVREGKVRFLGLCELSERTLRRAHAVHPISAVQMEYSLWTRDVEARLAAVFDELGVSLMAFSPLARGMLTGKLRHRDQLGPDDVRRKYPRFSAENLPKNVALVDRLGTYASRLGCTLPQVALAWLFANNPKAFAVCGCDTLDFLTENMGALAVTLGEQDVQEIGALFAPGVVAGDRYHASMMQLLAKD